MESRHRKTICPETPTKHDPPTDDDHCADSLHDHEPIAHGQDDESNDPDDLDPTETNDADWEVFLADDDERDPLPEHGDFWNDFPNDD